ncbi:hypothetical protein [Agrobacterium bohemicum]|uniref:hypothetical protein n=1 Tax=Agrobacterium bohemicum TaxID=2052828 RepID=UPI00156AB16D|nr:hypothetical protein [Agrobacterium bohemicum]
MQLSQAGHKIKNIGLRRVPTGMIFFCCLDNQLDNGRETTTTTTAFGHCVVNLGRHDKLPTVVIKHLVDDIADVVIGDVITAADEHGSLPVWRNTLFSFLNQNRIVSVKKKMSSMY